MKKTIFTLALAILTMASCSDDSKKLSNDGIYGEIPGIIQEIKNKFQAEIDEQLGAIEDAKHSSKMSLAQSFALVMVVSAMETEYYDKVEEATADALGAMKGKELPFVMGDSVPYTIDKGVTITDIKYARSEGIAINAAMDITMQQEVTTNCLYFYLLVENDTTALIKSYKYIDITKDMGFEVYPDKGWMSNDKYIIKKGDKLHVDFKFTSNKCNPKMMASCKRLKFVTEKEYNRNNVDKTVKDILQAEKEKKEKEKKKK